MGRGKGAFPAQNAHVWNGTAETYQHPRRHSAAQENGRRAGNRKACHGIGGKQGIAAGGQVEGRVTAKADSVTQNQ